ncbi:TOG array regulator of axonemal microtubules protein 1 [Trichonephila clavipes]|uniref:TOG array regulator of axonemal microtubules protein 1 n=1 Tax=Trichonephila clavipes TaxID=2585209 RepID=A0A8X6VZC5_TRICX|nr:TOG array regulator of axonemal microtubules protein 1 [Trichonephila clavipes]
MKLILNVVTLQCRAECLRKRNSAAWTAHAHHNRLQLESNPQPCASEASTLPHTHRADSMRTVICTKIAQWDIRDGFKADSSKNIWSSQMGVHYPYSSPIESYKHKLRLVVGVLLAKSGNRTLAAYFRLVIKSLFKIMNSTTAQKTALAFIHEGSRHPNKASRETAAQFLVLLTEQLGPVNSLASPLAGHMLKCATLFVFDCSALTR